MTVALVGMSCEPSPPRLVQDELLDVLAGRRRQHYQNTEKVRKMKRSGFTLIELLVVITIIASLVLLSASAVLKAIEVQQTSNTRSVLTRVQSVLEKNWSAVKDQALKETIQPDTKSWLYANFCQGIDDANSAGRIRVLYVKLRMRQAFPMNFTEALYAPAGLAGSLCPCSQLQPLPGYKTYLISHGISLSSGLSWESSACLLMALTRGSGSQQIDSDTLMAGGAGGIDNSYGVPVLNDAWGRPIYFCRSPAGCPSLNPSTSSSVLTLAGDGSICFAQPGVNDPGDPQGYLQAPSWATSIYATLFQSDTNQLLAPLGCSYRLAPMVGSGGPGRDRQPAFNPVTFAPLPGGAPLYGK